MNFQEYVAALPLVDTASLPAGTLFWVDYRIYEIVELDSAGYSRAREWRKSESTDVALVPGSRLAQRLPVVNRGRLMPRIDSREKLLHHGRSLSFVFPTEQTALDAASLDVALVGKRAGLYVRRNSRFPAFEITNGAAVMRRYYFSRTRFAQDTNLADIKPRLQEALIPHLQGPMYWRLLPTWDESPYDLNQTIAYRPDDILKRLKELDEALPAPTDEDTVANPGLLNSHEENTDVD